MEQVEPMEKLERHFQPAGTSDKSDICDGVISFWLRFYNGCLWDNFFFYNLKYSAKSEIFTKKLMVHSCLCQRGDPTYVEIFYLFDL